MIIHTDETIIRVRYKDTDQMGVAYHANYLVWFEVGRTELMRGLGIPYLEFENNGLYLPVIKAACEYKAPARYDDQLIVVTRIGTLRGSRIGFEYQVTRGAERLAEGGTEHAFTTFEGRPVNLSKHSPDLWERLCRAAVVTQ